MFSLIAAARMASTSLAISLLWPIVSGHVVMVTEIRGAGVVDALAAPCSRVAL